MATEHHEYNMASLIGRIVAGITIIIVIPTATCESYRSYQDGATKRAMIKAGYSPVAVKCWETSGNDGLSKEDRAKICTQVVLTEGKHTRSFKSSGP